MDPTTGPEHLQGLNLVSLATADAKLRTWEIFSNHHLLRTVARYRSTWTTPWGSRTGVGNVYMRKEGLGTTVGMLVVTLKSVVTLNLIKLGT